MKLKKAIAVLTAFIVIALSWGCDDKNNSGSAKSGADTSSSSSASKDEKDSKSDTFNIMDLPDICDKNAEHEGVYVARGMTTGVNLYIPSELKLYNGVVYEDKDQSCCPEEVPTVNAPFIVTDMDGKNNFQYTISKGEGDNLSFVSGADKEEYLSAFKQASEGLIDDIDITEFEMVRIGDFPAIKMVSTGKINGEEFEQTQLIVNACNLRAKNGVIYTFTYTDFTGELSDKIDDSISSIDFVNVDEVKTMFLEPDEYLNMNITSGKVTLPDSSEPDVSSSDNSYSCWYSRQKTSEKNKLYKIRIPKDWEFVSGCNDDLIISNTVIAQPSEADGATLVFTREEITEENNYEDFGKEDYLNIIAASVEKAEIIDYEEGTSCQYQTRYISCKATQSGVDMTMTLYVAYNTDESRAYSILLTDPKGDYQDIADNIKEYMSYSMPEPKQVGRKMRKRIGQQ